MHVRQQQCCEIKCQEQGNPNREIVYNIYYIDLLVKWQCDEINNYFRFDEPKQ